MSVNGEKLLRKIVEYKNLSWRESQGKMVAEIDNSLNNLSDKEIIGITVNAPVGTGKTIGYLSNIISRKGRTIISTTTKALQEQIFEQELPELAKTIEAINGEKITFSILKGKSNYACMQLLQEEIYKSTGEIREKLEELKAYLEEEPGRDAEAYFSKLPSKVVYSINYNNPKSKKFGPWIKQHQKDEMLEKIENCSLETPLVDIQKIAQQKHNPYVAAYAQSLLADIVVMNTTLLVFELKKTKMIKRGIISSEFTPNIMSGVKNIVIDEAHHAKNKVSEAYRQEISKEKITKELDTLSIHCKNSGFANMSQEIKESSKFLTQNMPQYKEGKNLNQKEREEVAEWLESIYAPLEKISQNLKKDSALTSYVLEFELGLLSTIKGISRDLTKGEEKSFFFRATASSNKISIVPVNVSFFIKDIISAHNSYNIYAKQDIKMNPAVLMCSGTIGKNIPYGLGFNESVFINVDSPFDLKKARLLIPQGIGKPSDHNWMSKSKKIILESIKAANGRTLVLTTSRKNLEVFTDFLREEKSNEYKVLSQIDNMSKKELVKKFKEDEESILVGTMGFWEGVDVPGRSCGLVIMDKIPFPMPNDEIFSAQRTYAEEKKQNPFMSIDVNYAAAMIAQGAGRLIRSVNDVGGVIILDERIIKAKYGQKVVSLMPNWPLTNNHLVFNEWLKITTNNPERVKTTIIDKNWKQLKAQNNIKNRTMRSR